MSTQNFKQIIVSSVGMSTKFDGGCNWIEADSFNVNEVQDGETYVEVFNSGICIVSMVPDLSYLVGEADFIEFVERLIKGESLRDYEK